MKKFLVVKMDVTELTADEIAALEFEMVVQGETSEDYVEGESGHPNAPFVSAETVEVEDADEVTAKLAEMLGQDSPAVAIAAQGLQGSTQQTGRGPSGKLRNFAQMKDAKLIDVCDTIMDENNDEEAMEAISQEMKSRGL